MGRAGVAGERGRLRGDPPPSGSENGYCDFLKKQIAIRPDVSGAQAVKSLIHELGHALLHAEGPVASLEVAEVEVESVAFVVCDPLGLDTGDYSFAYVSRWSGRLRCAGDVGRRTGQRLRESDSD